MIDKAQKPSRRSRSGHFLLRALFAGWLASFVTAAAAVDLPSIRIEADDTLYDQAGRRVRVTRPFERIVALYGAHVENLFALGHGGRVIGVPPRTADPAAAADRPAFSYRDDPEKFLAARPDLVLTRPMIERAYPNLIRRLERSGIQVVSLQPGTVDEMYVYWEALGLLAGDRAGGRRLTVEFRARVDAVQALARTVERPRRVYFEAIHDKFKTFSPGAMPLFALDAVGAVNAAPDAQPSRGTNIANYGKERILARGRQIDVYLAQTGPMNPVTRARILAEPGFDAIRAVRDGAVYLVEERLVSRPTPQLIEGMLEIGRAIYPEVFTAAACRRVSAREE